MKYFIQIVLLLFLLSCNSNKINKIDSKEILVKIGDDTILAKEFIQRSEYVLRPDYCSNSNIIHKKIILNSLIAEKLLALEADSSINHNLFSDYIYGIKLQRMRDKLFYENQSKVKISSDEVGTYLRYANRTYDVSFVLITDSLSHSLISNRNSKNIFNELLDSAIAGKRKISFYSENNYEILKKLFLKPLVVNDIIGPIDSEKDNQLFIRIDSLTKHNKFSELAEQEYYNKVQQHIFNIKHLQNYSEFIHSVMENKNLEFNHHVFIRFIENLYFEKLQFEKSKNELFKQNVWPNNDLPLYGSYMSNNISDTEIIFYLDKQAWSFIKVKNLIKNHPLVFRDKKITKEEFPNAVKNAIADLIRDHYLNREAIKLNYDNDPYIEQYTQMWRQHFIANALRHKLLATKITDINEIEYLNPIIDSLFNKYSDKIYINFNIFDSINLTSIPMYVSHPNMAYQNPVPKFPLLTDLHSINYGNKIIN